MNDDSEISVLNNRRTNPEISLKAASTSPCGSGIAQDLPSQHERFEFNGFVLDSQRGCLLENDREIALRPKTFEVLLCLVRNQGKLVSKNDLIKAVWPDVFVTEDSLFQCVAEARRALRDDGQSLIRTLPRRGYRFDAALAPRPGTQILPAADSPELEAAPVAAPTIKRTRISRPTCVASLVAVVLIAVAAVSSKPWQSGAGSPSSSSDPISLVVLPLRALGEEPWLEAFATGLTVELTSDLSRLPGATVISPATALKEQSADVRQIGRNLNVRYAVQGTVARTEKEIRINIQLIETTSGRHVWADRQDREAARATIWQDEIVGGIANALNARLTRLESERGQRDRPRNPLAYRSQHAGLGADLHGQEAGNLSVRANDVQGSARSRCRVG